MKIFVLKTASAIVLISLVLTDASLLLPRRAEAEVLPSTVPTTVKKDEQSIMHEMMAAATTAIMNSALQKMQFKFNRVLEQKLGIKSYLKYQQALVESKYLIDAYKSSFGSGSVATSTKSVTDIANQAEAGNLKNYSTAQTKDLAIRNAQSKTKTAGQKRQEIQKMIVGASSLFTSSIACGEVNEKAIANTAQYLASSFAGFKSSEIDYRNSEQFYGSMSRLGAPEASPEFWKLQFEDIAKQKEAEAKAAAALEVLGPGLKSPQERDAKGNLKTKSSLNLVSVGQQNSQNSLFTMAGWGSRSIYDTSSLKGFVGSVISIEVGKFISSRLFGLFGSSNLSNIVSSAIGSVGTGLVRGFALKLYDQISADIFNGGVLEESTGCRKPSKVTNFTAADKNFTNLDATVPDTDPTAPILMFEANSDSIMLGDKVTLSWDATALGSGLQVTLEGGSVGGAQSASGDVEDEPTETTTYTLTVTGPGGINQTKSVTVTVDEDESVLRFQAEPVSVEQNRKARITWDVSQIADEAGIEMIPDNRGEDDESFPHDGLEAAGTDCMTVDQIGSKLLKLHFEKLSQNGTITRELTLTGVAPAVGKTFDFVSNKQTVNVDNGESAVLSWNINKYNNAIAKFWDGAEVASDGTQISEDVTVTPTATTTFSIVMAEANNCGDIEQREVEIGIRHNHAPIEQPRS